MWGNSVWAERGLNTSKKNVGNFIFQKRSRNHVKLLANWCWQSELRQIGWFSPRFLELFWNIKMAQKFFMSSRDLSQPSLNYPTFSKKINHASVHCSNLSLSNLWLIWLSNLEQVDDFIYQKNSLFILYFLKICGCMKGFS